MYHHTYPILSTTRMSGVAGRKSKTSKQSTNRGWWRVHFHDCPVLNDQPLFHMYGSSVASGGKTKVYCKSCFVQDWNQLLAEEQKAVEQGTLPEARRKDILEKIIWESNNAHVLSSAAAGLINHLINCQHTSSELKAMAIEKKAQTKKQNIGDSPQTTRSSPQYPSEPSIPMPNFLSVASTSTGPGSIAMSAPGPFHVPDLVLNDTGLSVQSYRYHPYLTPTRPPFASDYLPSYPPSSFNSPNLVPADNISIISRSSSISSLAPSDSLSAAGSRTRQKGRKGISSRIGATQIVPWTQDRRRRWERLLVELTASAGFSLSWVENPVWHTICEEFLPEAPRTSRKVLTNRLLRQVTAELKEHAKALVRGRDVTLQADGWTGLNNNHLIAFMMTCEKLIHTVKVHDASGERKTAEALLQELENVYALLRDEWNANVIGLVTDASGESRKARRLFGEKYPWIVVLDCYAHQINLVVGDLFRSQSELMQYTEMATELITWLRSKTYILHHLPLAVLRAVITRWTAHYTAYRRLLDLSLTLIRLAEVDLQNSDERTRVMITGERKAQEKARKMIETIRNPIFWQKLTLVKVYLEPLAIAANITQAAFCRMDQVLLSFGFLVMQYQTLTEDPVAQQAIIGSLETRWKKADQELFIALVLVNPFYRAEPFATSRFMNIAGICALLMRVWKRLENDTSDPSQQFVEYIRDFLHGEGHFQDLSTQIRDEVGQADRGKRQPDPVAVLKSFCHPTKPAPDFITFACRLLSISANSASCERLFSTFGNTLTKLRTRLSTENLQSLSEVKLHVRNEYLKPDKKERIKRQFGHLRSEAEHTAQPPASIPTVPSTVPRSVSVTTPASSTLESSSQPGGSNPSFRDIVNQHAQAVDEDNQDNESVQPSTSTWQQIPLSSLFDFSTTHWKEHYEKWARLTYDEELEFYELLELDADGDVDPDFDDDILPAVFAT